MRALSSCCLTCRAWVPTSQKLLFTWVILRGSASLDNLLHLYRTSRLSHVLHRIRRISISYNKPGDKLGEALPRIAIMAPPNLLRIDVTADLYCNNDYEFPFHDSFPSLLTPLHHVRILNLSCLDFTTISDLRQLVSCFRGLQVLQLDCKFPQEHGSVVQGVSHRRANPLLTKIITWRYRDFLWLWLSPNGSGTSRPSRYSTAEISRPVPSISAALATFIRMMVKKLVDLLYLEDYGHNMEWKLEDCATVDDFRCESIFSSVVCRNSG